MHQLPQVDIVECNTEKQTYHRRYVLYLSVILNTVYTASHLPQICIYTMAPPQNYQTNEGGKEKPPQQNCQLQNHGHNCIPSPYKLSPLRYFATERTASCLKYLGHNFQTGADQIIVLQATWEATVKQITLTVRRCNRRPVQNLYCSVMWETTAHQNTLSHS